jgi:hypothetical protein
MSSMNMFSLTWMIEPSVMRFSVPFRFWFLLSFLRTAIPPVAIIPGTDSGSITSNHWSASPPPTADVTALMIPILLILSRIIFLLDSIP